MIGCIPLAIPSPFFPLIPLTKCGVDLGHRVLPKCRENGFSAFNNEAVRLGSLILGAYDLEKVK